MSRHAHHASASRAGIWLVVASSLVTGIAARAMLINLAPRHGYFADHDDFVRWGIQATDDGVLSLYSRPAPRHPAVVVRPDGTRFLTVRRFDRILNYPPLSAYAIWIEGVVHERIDPNRYANTTAARALYGTASGLGDVLVAAGCSSIVYALATPFAAAAVFGAVFLLPPLVIDGAFWGQTDSWVLAAAVWMVYAMTKERWRSAGILWGIGLGLKPQAVLFVPVWLIAMLTVRPVRAVVDGAALASTVFAVALLPFVLSSGTDWIGPVVIDNLVDRLPFKTLYSFNVWYLDLLVRGGNDATERLLGLSSDAWGRIAFGAAVAAGATFFVRGWRLEPERWVLLTAWILLSAVMLLTRVHERYVILCLPFLIILAQRNPAMRGATVLLVVTATAQLTMNNWKTLSAMTTESDVRDRYERVLNSAPPEKRARMDPLEVELDRYRARRVVDLPKEWALVTLSLLAATGATSAMSRWPNAASRK